uniref:Uncharacterized protein n=1 Tax=Myotis myotis TaxID=51298 RepID=A0A7J7ZX50_MYOMY|nr:hypothetical protein mMyoMyo1_009666 [Myotis myotis]
MGRTIALSPEIVSIRREHTVKAPCEIVYAIHIHFVCFSPLPSPVGAGPAALVGACQIQNLEALQLQSCPEGVSVACRTEEAASAVGPCCASFPSGSLSPLGHSWGVRVTPFQCFLFLWGSSKY